MKSRREEYADATRAALLDAAEAAFIERGYAGASLDDIAAATRVTKGALYHHFANKQAVFEAVYHRLGRSMVGRAAAAASSGRDPWQQALASFGGFLAMCEEEPFRRIMYEEAPGALGWRRWRELDDPFGLSLIRATLRRLADAGLIKAGAVDMLARFVLGALTEAAMAIAAEAPDRRTPTRRAAERTLATMLSAFRTATPAS